jgi:hypothetical protein
VTKHFLPALALLGAAAVACGPAATHTAAVRPAAAPQALPSSAAPSPARPAAPKPADPLTGLTAAHAPIVVIKVDNATTARQYQRGLGHAAIVYQELVESGTTRLAAVYDNAYSGEVGPIRSVRETDIELFPEFGRVAVAFSGGNSGVKGQFHDAVRAGKLIDASYDVLTGSYRLGEQRVDARNFFSTPAKLSAASHGATAKDIGLHFGPLAGGSPATSGTVSYSDRMTVGFRYDPSSGTWVMSQDGTPMSGVAPANVIVQSVQIRKGRYVDVEGAPSPYTVSVGSGNTVVFRDGVAIRGTWSRPSVRSGTHYLDAHGKDIALKPGSTWVLLLPSTRSASF